MYQPGSISYILLTFKIMSIFGMIISFNTASNIKRKVKVCDLISFFEPKDLLASSSLNNQEIY